MKEKILQLDPRDNVLIALVDLRQGEVMPFAGKTYSLASSVPAKHKFVTQTLQPGDRITMYGVTVGSATKPLPEGSLITTANVHHQAAAIVPKSQEIIWNPPDVSKWKDRKFFGYPRSDGQVGTRNYWLVVPLVFCENRNIGVLKQAFEEELGFAAPQIYRSQVAELVKLYREGKMDKFDALPSLHDGVNAPHQKVFENIDGIKFLIHEGGCGGTREDSTNLCGLLAGYINHPNVAGATVLSLGCQNAQAGILRQQIRDRNPNFNKPLFILEHQMSGTEYNLLSDAIRQTFSGMVEANKVTRVPSPLSHLTVGLKCGGSDGFSGISANPAIGHTSDVLVALGGKTILSEFPELCGVEQEFINRSKRKEDADRFIHLMQSYNSRAQAVGAGFDMNPSPGNIRDGLITDAMKSAGAAKKGGTSPVAAVIDYPEYAAEPGLNLQCTPGNDVECVTAQVGAGANVVLFTTGLGTPTGNPIAPVIKLSTNSTLAQRMSDIIDVDTGRVISGEITVERMGEEILDFVIKVSSGEIRTKAEVKAQADFIPWKRGVSL
jgi:altronate hydrolase